jgi:hypothetical protein
MARIKIKDLPRDMKISAEEMKRVRGGIALTTNTLLNTMDLNTIDHKIDSLSLKIEDSAITRDLASNDLKW